MSFMKDAAIQADDRSRGARPCSADIQAARDEASDMTGVLSGCYDAVRSLRHSAELDQDVVITLRATSGYGDVWFVATFEPLGIVIHGEKTETYSVPAMESLSASFDQAVREFDGQIAYAKLAAEFAPEVLA